ncbi:alpha-ketoglutarate-dependent dioxygenase AlkB [Gramella sp. KN1008]|uniref:alpha-ketoglutarate-dependent dioxygenase AlkB family protein n=1 Tax=Gramella sp. KN1008 TaxID=2529298 RepID=UPI00103DE396|nr:alpha-ketoglutarate-dependent dioxygenase AlkB [Gramella sp. KN1008]TBW28390.1 alpha-ketoglutarate-dependent dioxygenase AlkB [Gramella sp. KN1008]
MDKEIINLPDASVEYYPEFFEAQKADEFLDELLFSLEWKQDKIKMFGKEIFQPRLTSFYGEASRDYTYSGLKLSPLPFTQTLEKIKLKCEKYSGTRFNACLANLYRDGSDSMGWHSDDEKELGSQPLIASVSFGGERVFHLKHKTNPTARHKIRLQHGSLLIMKGTTQQFWKHQLPKTKKSVAPRINLTFRKIYQE